MGDFVLGLFLCVLGGALVYYSKQMSRWFGRWSWAEQYFGSTAAGYVLLGFVTIIIGILFITGVISIKP